MLIRIETEADHAAVAQILKSAFDDDGESRLVTRLRSSAKPLMSLVAEQDGQILGYILFSPATLDSSPSLAVMGLAPMAVHPDCQRQGIGTALVEAGLNRCRDAHIGAVAVLGHSEYYPRFGFRKSSEFDIKCEYDVPAEAFMLMEMQQGFLKGGSGILKYHEEFNKL